MILIVSGSILLIISTMALPACRDVVGILFVGRSRASHILVHAAHRVCVRDTLVVLIQQWQTSTYHSGVLYVSPSSYSYFTI